MKPAMKARLEAIQKKGRHLALVGGTALYAGAANAAIDTTAVTDSITSQSSNVELIAVAVLGVLAVIAGVAYLRRVIK